MSEVEAITNTLSEIDVNQIPSILDVREPKTPDIDWNTGTPTKFLPPTLQDWPTAEPSGIAYQQKMNLTGLIKGAAYLTKMFLEVEDEPWQYSVAIPNKDQAQEWVPGAQNMILEITSFLDEGLTQPIRSILTSLRWFTGRRSPERVMFDLTFMLLSSADSMFLMLKLYPWASDANDWTTGVRNYASTHSQGVWLARLIRINIAYAIIPAFRDATRHFGRAVVKQATDLIRIQHEPAKQARTLRKRRNTL
nr:MAG: hypothetical protein [Wufeng shrew permutotetravirus 7]